MYRVARCPAFGGISRFGPLVSRVPQSIKAGHVFPLFKELIIIVHIIKKQHRFSKVTSIKDVRIQEGMVSSQNRTISYGG